MQGKVPEAARALHATATLGVSQRGHAEHERDGLAFLHKGLPLVPEVRQVAHICRVQGCGRTQGMWTFFCLEMHASVRV